MKLITLKLPIKEMHIDMLRDELKLRIKEHSKYDINLSKQMMTLSLKETETRKKQLLKLRDAKNEVIKEFTRRGVTI